MKPQKKKKLSSDGKFNKFSFFLRFCPVQYEFGNDNDADWKWEFVLTLNILWDFRPLWILIYSEFIICLHVFVSSSWYFTIFYDLIKCFFSFFLLSRFSSPIFYSEGFLRAFWVTPNPMFPLFLQLPEKKVLDPNDNI